ncbi:hypothetical protein DIPPA_10720 [Diplonema papillatum]|nr:hypothetical protein DIPPA_10720 [Diplonema papillatum]
MSVMRLNDEGWLQKVGKVSNYYYNVLSAEGRPGIAYALRSSYLDVIDYSSDAAPKIISRTLYFGGYSCEYLEQYVADGTATVFISCPLRGIYAVNATTDERHTTFGSTNPVALPRSGQCEGMAVDKVRKLLFVATSAEDDSGVQMYNITTPWSPISLEHSPTTKSAFDVVLDGTMLYVAASTTLEIFETATGKFVAVGICCEVGNNLDFVGLAVYKGVVFASDYIYGQTVVINATDPTKPYYAGHRDLPSSARGKAGIVIAPMKDNAVRIFQSGYLGGLVVFSDKEPGATPVPGTPLPPPPVEPQDCGHIFASETTSCPDGTAMMAQQVLSSCIKTADDLCTSMKAGAIYFFDTTLANRYVAKSATGTCTFKYVYNEVPVGALCGSPAPHTTYLEGHKPGLLPDNAYVRDVVLMGESTKEIAVAHSYGISVLTADGSTGFQHRGTQPGYYYAVLPSADNKDIVFGSRYAYIDIINFAPPETPVRLSFLYYVSYYGYHLEQWYEHGKFHYLYVSADREGVYILDVMNKNAPKKTHATASIQTLNGDTQGMTLDKGREILFVVADGSFSALYAYNVTQPTVPILYGSVGTEWACYELRVSGNIVFVSCDEKLEVFDTTDPVNMTAHSICCQFAGALELRGMELYDGLIYAVDYYRKLVVINVTDTAVPYFVSHRELAPISGKSMLGQVGVAVGALNDGVVRVIVAGYSAGIYALSDTKPPPTPAPPTQIPAPPAIPPNCSQLYVFDTTTASDSSMTCEDGHVLFPKEHIEECMDELCPQISSGDGYAGYDGPNARYMVSKVGATCKFVTSSTKLTKYICGPAPPYTTYLTEYEDGFIPAYALVYAVLPLDPAAKNVMLGTNRGYSIISFQDDGRFRAASSVTATYGYRQMTPVKEEANLVFAVRYYYFDIIDVSDVMNPIQKASLRTTYYCQCVSHYKVDLISVAYVSCDTYGMYVIDASDLTKPASLRVVKPSQGQARGTAVDDDRSLLYMGTESTGFGIATFNLSNPKAPEEINYVPSKGNVYQVRLFGTVLYAATAKGLEIYETKNTGTPEGISTCCNTGPALNLRDMYMYNDMVFAADYYNMMVVVNVTDPLLPHYLGHRDMPTSGYGYAISVNMMDDGNVRVLQGCGSVGLVVGSDAKPMPTPVPQTPLPPPPRPPATDCSQLEILPVTDLENPCPAGSVLASQWLINVCRAKACPDLTTSMVVMIDSSPNVYFLTTNGNTCSTYYKFNTIPTHAACGYAPPHTMYLEMHKEVLDDNAWAIDVAVLENKNDVIVATTTGLTVLHALHSVGFRRVAHVPGDYVAVLAAEGDKDVAYALLIDTFDIIALSPPEEPDVSSSKFLPSDSCVDMVQYRMQNVFHVVYISCGTDGVFAMDTRDDDNAVLLNNGSAVVVTSRSGPSTGLAVDEARKLLFVVTSGSSAGVHMLDIADPFAPSEVAFNHTQYTADDIKVVGTLAYVAAKDKLEIWETTNNEFKQISWCCQNAPALELKGIQYWDGLIYASDYYYKLMVINVTDPFVPEFVAHRRLPYNNGYAYGQKGIAVAEMDDGIVRVFQAARTGGVAIFSDEEPLPTPAPDTPLPPPPMVPPNCDALYVNSMTGNNPCKDGDILMSYHVIDACLPEVCGMLQGGESVGYDEAMSVLSNGGGSCVFEPATATVDRFICGPTPPHTRYMEIYSEYFLPPGSRAVDVCVIGDYQTERDDFLVATSVELTVMHIKNNGRLTKSGSLPNAYTAVVGAREKATMAYALKENGLDVISVEDETKPEVFASVTFGSYQCTNLAQMKNGVLHYVYAACGTSGIFATDVWLNREAKLVGDGAILIPEKGVARGMEVDAKRAILFVAVQNTSGTPGVYMYNIANAGEPAELGFQETDNSANEVLLVDTLLFIAAETQLDMYDTEGGVFTLRGWCCHYGPELHLVGLDYLNGLIYSSDWHGRLIVINVTDPGSSYYAGHRDLPPAAGGVRGKEGEILLFDTVVYVATGARLDVVQTKAGSLQYVPWCCSTGPTMNIVALAIYEGLLYAADSNSMLVVIDVNDPTAPYYVGHRNLPFSAEATQVSVGKLSDRIPRVLVASPAGGVFVFSDEEPVVTPSPPTRVPPPMKTPPNCDAMYIQAYSSVDDIYCKKGDVLMSYTEIAACSTEVCALVSQSGQSSVGYDAVNRRFTSSTSSCSFSYVFGKATHNVCGPPPPYTAYLQRYDNTFLASYSRAVDVTVVPHGDAVYVATTKELVALQLQPDGNFWRAGYVRENYVAVVPVEGQTGYLFALGPQSLAVIDFKNLATPTVVSEVRVSSYVCANLEQVILNKKHYVFCSCNRDGIFVADASDLQQLKMVKSSALITLPSGPSKGMFVDEGRELLFGVSTSRGVHMYNISDPTSPTVVDSITPDGPAYEIVLVGTLAYVAAGNRLEIYETDGGKFVENGWCCQWSPPVWLVGLDVFNGLAYASDWTASLIVMNVSDSFHPYYIGHREMPAGSGGNSNGKEGLIVAPLSDDTVRVFLAADNGGLVVFSDVEPGPTPSPPTPLPLAPHEPFDCTDYHVVEINDQTDNGCSQGYVPAPDHVVGVCRTHLCTELPEGKFASYDAQHTYYLRNMDGNCGQFYSSNTIATYKVCGPAPPHTSFVEVRQYDIMALANNVKDVAVLGFDKNDIAVAASDGLAILHAFHSTGFKLAAKVPGNYVSVLADSMDPDIVFALKSHYLDIITLTPPESPEVLGTATLNSYACQMMDQYQKGTSIHMMYVACHEQGIFAIDLRNDRDPQNVHGDEAAIHTFTGETKGVRVASDRALLFASTWGTDAAVHMFDLTNHTDPVDITHVQAKYSVFDMVLDGTILFCAASQQVIVYETVDNKFEQIGVCCNERAPVMNMVGLDFFDGFVYASDYNRRLIIINATNPVDPFYIGHREMRPQNGYIASGKEGIVVSALGDGVVRVFQSGNYGGLFIYSDEEPVATLAPPTRAPPPPEVPPNCDAVYVADECSEGDVVISEHVIDACSDEICTQMTDPAGFDGAAGKVYVKTESSCDYQETDTLPTRFVCGPAPPHTAYMSMYDDAVLPKYSRAVDVVVMGPAKDEVIVATTTALVVLQLEDGLFKRHSSITASYVAIIPSDDQPNILYGIRSSSFDVISVLDIQAPEIVATLRLPSYSCSNLEQMVYGSGGLRTVYASCKRDGVFAIDASDNLNPVLANNTAVAKPDGEAKGLLVDQERQLMFVVSSGSSAAVFMHDIAVPSLALQKLSVDTNFSAYELAMDGTILYVAAEATLQIYQTANFKLDLQSYCCSFGPELFIVGIEYYNGMIYASDWRGKLVVMNVTQTSAPYYVGHRDLPSSSGNSNGKEGIIVTSMSDDQVRVFQAADDGGLIVFSDVKPPATPQPDTPLPAPPAPPLNCDDMVVNTKAEGVGWCCNDDETAPNLFIVGLTYFDNMIYASDWNRKIVVFNVTDPANVYYIGHRDLPSKANGKEGIVAAQLQDGIIRVFQAADQGGLMVFSDEEPIMTPSPRTPMPPPPFLPPDCPALYVHEPLVGDDVNPCKEGDILMDRHIVDVCMNDVCQKLADGEMAGFVEGGKAVQKAGTGCSVVDDASLHFRFVCGPAPPYTSYVMQYPAGPYVVDSALVGSDGRYIAASTDTHVMFYRLTSAAYLMEVAKVENPGYKSVVQAKHNPNVVYALRYNALDVIDAQDPTRPAVVGTLPFASTRCARLIQMKTEVTNVLYVSCHDSGIFVVDVRSDTAPMLLNDGNGLTTDEGEVKGVLVDSNRTLLFTVTWGVSALHMFDVSAPAVPVLLATEPTDAAAFEMTQNEFLIYIAAGAELEIVDTSDGKLQRLSSCCSHGPGMWIVGLAFFNNLIYASDWTGKLVVMNVTTGGSPYYVGHRDLPAGSNGKEGLLYAADSKGKMMVFNVTDPVHPYYVGHKDMLMGVGAQQGMEVGWLADGYTRVFQAAGDAGLIVFSDIDGMGTLPPMTATPNTMAPGTPRTDAPSTYCIPLVLNTRVNESATECKEGFELISGDELASCETEICKKMSSPSTVGFLSDESAFVKTVSGDCSIVFMDSMTTSTFVCKPEGAVMTDAPNTYSPDDPRSAAGGDESGESTGLLVAAIVGPILVMLLCVASLSAVYVLMKRQISRTANEELQDFDYVQTKEFDGPDEAALTDADVLAATVSQNSNYDKL